jgi:acyl carrier protein
MNNKLKSVLSEVFDLKISEIDINLTKDDVSSWDSLRQMDLVTSLENEFNITLEMMEIASMDSVKSIVDALKNKGISFEG